MRCALIIIILLFSGIAEAAPSVSSVSGAISHGGSIVVTGSSFSTKSPAAPVMWDDGEHASTLSGKGYDDYEPSTASSTANIQYHTGTFRTITNPHARGTRFIAGGHEDNRPYGTSNGNTVGIMKILSDSIPIVYHTYYHTLDPAIPQEIYDASPQWSNNFKFTEYEPNGSTSIYTAPLYYHDYSHTKSPQYSTSGNLSMNCRGSAVDNCDDTPAMCITQTALLGNWMRQEELFDADSFTQIKMMDNSLRTYGTSTTCRGDGHSVSKGGLTIGGYACHQYIVYSMPTASWTGPDGNGEYYATWAGGVSTRPWILARDNVAVITGTLGSLTTSEWAWDEPNNRIYIGFDPSSYTLKSSRSVCGSINETTSGLLPGVEHGGHDDMYRYFDDVYIDTTFSRVMLANNANFNLATIIEPQIPSAWSDTEITATVNLGALPTSGTVYLFVFDSTNTPNTTGYEVTISETEASRNVYSFGNSSRKIFDLQNTIRRILRLQ